jgi:hypothetical protein
VITVDGTDYEYKAEAEGGLTLSDGARWWGTRVRYRRAGIADKRWAQFILLDVHPFDTGLIEVAIKAHATGKRIADASPQI